MIDTSRIALLRQLYTSLWSLSPYCPSVGPYCPPVYRMVLAMYPIVLAVSERLLGLLAAVAATVSATVSILLIVLVSDGLAWYPLPEVGLPHSEWS